jgi:hypothetical protein
MKNKSPDSPPFYFFTQRIRVKRRDNLPVPADPGSEVKRDRGMLDNMLRWEDDGGSAAEFDFPLPLPAENNTPRLVDAAGDDLSYDETNR